MGMCDWCSSSFTSAIAWERVCVCAIEVGGSLALSLSRSLSLSLSLSLPLRSLLTSSSSVMMSVSACMTPMCRIILWAPSIAPWLRHWNTSTIMPELTWDPGRSPWTVPATTQTQGTLLWAIGAADARRLSLACAAGSPQRSWRRNHLQVDAQMSDELVHGYGWTRKPLLDAWALPLGPRLSHGATGFCTRPTMPLHPGDHRASQTSPAWHPQWTCLCVCPIPRHAQAQPPPRCVDATRSYSGMARTDWTTGVHGRWCLQTGGPCYISSRRVQICLWCPGHCIAHALRAPRTPPGEDGGGQSPAV